MHRKSMVRSCCNGGEFFVPEPKGKGVVPFDSRHRVSVFTGIYGADGATIVDVSAEFYVPGSIRENGLEQYTSKAIENVQPLIAHIGRSIRGSDHWKHIEVCWLRRSGSESARYRSCTAGAAGESCTDRGV